MVEGCFFLDPVSSTSITLTVDEERHRHPVQPLVWDDRSPDLAKPRCTIQNTFGPAYLIAHRRSLCAGVSVYCILEMEIPLTQCS